MKNFINISDHSSNDLRAIIDEAKSRKLSDHFPKMIDFNYNFS